MTAAAREFSRTFAMGFFFGRLRANETPLLDVEDAPAFAAAFIANGANWGAIEREYDAFTAALIAERDAAQQAHEVRV